jgi:hypothetical protein
MDTILSYGVKANMLTANDEVNYGLKIAENMRSVSSCFKHCNFSPRYTTHSNDARSHVWAAYLYRPTHGMIFRLSKLSDESELAYFAVLS